MRHIQKNKRYRVTEGYFYAVWVMCRYIPNGFFLSKNKKDMRLIINKIYAIVLVIVFIFFLSEPILKTETKEDRFLFSMIAAVLFSPFFIKILSFKK